MIFKQCAFLLRHENKSKNNRWSDGYFLEVAFLLSIPFACWIHTRKPKRKRKHIMIIFFFRVGKKGHTGIYILGVHSNGFCENTFVLSLFRATKFKHSKTLKNSNSIFGGKFKLVKNNNQKKKSLIAKKYVRWRCNAGWTSIPGIKPNLSF